jgi:hypothetical protein
MAMLLRLMLVGLVTGLGVQPATPDDLNRWMDEGRACLAQVLGLDEADMPPDSTEEDIDAPLPPDGDPMALAETLPNEAAVTAVNDEIFAAITDEMADDFAADHHESDVVLAQDESPASVPSFEPMWVPDDAGLQGEAYVLNRDADGTATEVDPMPTVAPTPEPNHRLAKALRLTANALAAWADLIEHGRKPAPYH